VGDSSAHKFILLEIISADTSHISLIRELTMQVWPQTYVPIIGESQVQYMLDRFYSPESLNLQMTGQGHKFIIGYLDGKPVAFAAYSMIETSVYKLHKLYIVANMQGKGIGRAMVDYIVADIATTGATALRLNVNIYNTAAMAFYERYGFLHFRDEDIDIGGGFFMNDHVFQYALQDGGGKLLDI
jgi:diamine N-acetyltransferase